MKNLLITVVAVLAIASCTRTNQLANENRELRNSASALLDVMEENDDIEKYLGSDELINLQDAVYGRNRK